MYPIIIKAIPSIQKFALTCSTSDAASALASSTSAKGSLVNNNDIITNNAIQITNVHPNHSPFAAQKVTITGKIYCAIAIHNFDNILARPDE